MPHESDEEHEEEEEPANNQLASLMSSIYGDVKHFNTVWKQVRSTVPAQLASLFHQALATPFLSTSSSAAKKRKKWLQEAVQSNSIQTSTFNALHLSHLEAPPLNYATVPIPSANRKLKPILPSMVVQ